MNRVAITAGAALQAEIVTLIDAHPIMLALSDAGVHHNTLRNMRNATGKRGTNLFTAVALLGAVGYTLKIVPLDVE